MEAEPHSTQRTVFVRTIERLLERPSPVTAVAPRSVEVIAFDRPEERVVFVLNRQDGDEILPVRDVVIELRGERPASRVRVLPDGPDLERERTRDGVRFTLPECRAWAVVAVEKG
jgi:hypothetical protein